MKPVASLIISVYDNVLFLKCVLDSLAFQTDKRFEVIVSEDGDSEVVKQFIEDYDYAGILFHLSQPDVGWGKNRALNKASVFANTNHLIYIDGDCVLHPRFIEFHVKNFDEKAFLAGKRIKLDKVSSQWLLEDSFRVSNFQHYLLKNYRSIKKRGGAFMEEGIFVNPNSLLGFIPRVRKMNHLKGCNMSFSKSALYAINGFDEDYEKPAVGEDADLTWRFRGKGYRMKSLRNLAVQYHLFHKESWIDQEENLKLMANKQRQFLFYCKNGIIK